MDDKMPNSGTEDETTAAQHALQIAFQTMQERCHQLENRLAAVEEENMRLRTDRSNDTSTEIVQSSTNVEPLTIKCLQEKVEELTKQKSQLTHHVLMVAAENRQLWNRLTRLTRTNKSLGSKLIKISDSLKQHPTSQSMDTFSSNVKDVPHLEINCENGGVVQEIKDTSLEEISLRLINSIMLEKSELEQQYSEMVALQNGADVNLRNVGFAYPDENDTDSLQQLKLHEAKLVETKEALLSQQSKLKKALHNLKKIQTVSKKVCQTGTQFDSDDSLRENGATQTSFLPVASFEQENIKLPAEDVRVCPICGIFSDKSSEFKMFHEHVLTHFASESMPDFELLP